MASWKRMAATRTLIITRFRPTGMRRKRTNYSNLAPRWKTGKGVAITTPGWTEIFLSNYYSLSPRNATENYTGSWVRDDERVCIEGKTPLFSKLKNRDLVLNANALNIIISYRLGQFRR